jgi:hypothetical protein
MNWRQRLQGAGLDDFEIASANPGFDRGGHRMSRLFGTGV